MTREPFDHDPMGYTPDDIARWLLDRLRCFGVLPRELVVTDLMGWPHFLACEDDGTQTLAPAVFEAFERLAGQPLMWVPERELWTWSGQPLPPLDRRKVLPWPSRR
jgi:hypothetical protein